MSENGAEKDQHNGNSALDWEIFDILCRDELGLSVSFQTNKKTFNLLPMKISVDHNKRRTNC